MRLAFFSMLFLATALISCEEPLEKFENNPPGAFIVSVVSTSDSTATISWTPSKDPDLDSVVYDVYLMGELQFPNGIGTQTFSFKNLISDFNYKGEVIARDNFFETTSAGFNFTTGRRE